MGRFASKGTVWTVLIVPADKELQLFEQNLVFQRYQHGSRIVLFERQDKPLDDCNAAMLTNCSESRLDILMSAPPLETIVPKLRAFVTDYIFWTPADPGNASPKEMTHLEGRRSLFPDRDAHDSA